MNKKILVDANNTTLPLSPLPLDQTLHLGSPTLASGVEVAQVGVATAQRGALWRRRPLAGVMLFFCRAGALELAFDGGGQTICHAGELYVAFPDTRLSLSVATQTRFAYLELQGPHAVRAILRLGFWNGFREPSGNDETFPDSLAALLEASPRRGRDEQVLVQLEQGLDAVWRDCRSRSRVPAFFDAMRIIHRLPPTALTTEKAAAALGISRTKFNQIFLAERGMRPGAYLASLKADIAKELLTDVSLNVSQVAKRTGFSSASALASFFRRLCGVTPKTFRDLKMTNRFWQENTNMLLLAQDKSSRLQTETL